MPQKHGLSHGLAAFVSVLAAGLLVGLLRQYTPFLIGLFDDVGAWLSRFILARWDREISPSLLSTAVLASLLAFVWGMAFAIINRRK